MINVSSAGFMSRTGSTSLTGVLALSLLELHQLGVHDLLKQHLLTDSYREANLMNLAECQSLT